MGRKPRSGSGGPFGRLFKSIVSVVILSALTVGIVYLIKTLYNTSPYELGKKSGEILSLLHINVNEEKAGEVAGKFVERISQTNIGSGVTDSREQPAVDPSTSPRPNIVLTAAIISDIHEDVASLNKALEMAKLNDVDVVFVLGDLTNYGDVNSLFKIKQNLDHSELPYYVLPGDHDLAQSVNVSNFVSVFDTDHEDITLNGITFLLLNNSANFSLIPEDQVEWFRNKLPSVQFVLMSQPLYTVGMNPPFDDMFMGSTREIPQDEEMQDMQREVQLQGEHLLSLIRQNSGVQAIFAGDHHKSNRLTDSDRPELVHYTVGATTDTLNELPQKLLQTPRFSLLTVDENGGYKVVDVVLE